MPIDSLTVSKKGIDFTHYFVFSKEKVLYKKFGLCQEKKKPKITLWMTLVHFHSDE